MIKTDRENLTMNWVRLATILLSAQTCLAQVAERADTTANLDAANEVERGGEFAFGSDASTLTKARTVGLV